MGLARLLINGRRIRIGTLVQDVHQILFWCSCVRLPWPVVQLLVWIVSIWWRSLCLHSEHLHASEELIAVKCSWWRILFGILWYQCGPDYFICRFSSAHYFISNLLLLKLEWLIIFVLFEITRNVIDHLFLLLIV